MHRCDHAEIYVLAISVLNNSATPALFASILSKFEQPISFSLSETLPRFKCLYHHVFGFQNNSLDDAGPSLPKPALCLSL